MENENVQHVERIEAIHPAIKATVSIDEDGVTVTVLRYAEDGWAGWAIIEKDSHYDVAEWNAYWKARQRMANEQQVVGFEVSRRCA